ncbi:MAG: hypothetical protein ACE5EX_05000, partial [Phycisphaerae bacterium]
MFKNRFNLFLILGMLFVPTAAFAQCGNGIVDGVEDCDPGPDVPGDCCSFTCTFLTAGTACTGNGVGSCTNADTCD